MICFLCSVIVFPLINIIVSIKPSDIINVFSSTILKQAMFNTVIECICSSVLSVLTGFLYAYAVVKTNIPFKKFFSIIPVIHLMTPPFVGGLSFILLLGRHGFITDTLLGLDVSLYGFWGLLIAQVLCFFPLAYLICLQTLRGINTNLERAAQSLGASKTKIFFTVTLPLCKTGILSALLFIAVSVLSDFGNPMIVAGRFRVLAVEIYTQLTGWLKTGTSAFLGVLLLIPSFLLFAAQNHILKKAGTNYSTIGSRNFFSESKKFSVKKITFSDILFFIFISSISLIILAQFCAIVAGSFQKLWGINTSFTTEHIKAAFLYTKELRNSIIFSISAAFLSTVIAILTSFFVHRTSLPLKKMLDSFIQVPGAVPGSLFGLAISLTAAKFHITDSSLLIILAMTIGFLPFSYRVITSVYSQIHTSMDNASSSLGGSPLQTLRSIILPLSSDGVFSGFLYSFIRAMGTVSAVIFLVSFNTPLASVKILNLAEEGFWGKAASLATLLTLTAFLILAVAMLLLQIIRGVKKWKTN